MRKQKIFQLVFVLTIAFVIVLGLANPVSAYETRTGEIVVIEAGEVVDDDLYITAATFILRGTVKGDLIVMGQTISIEPGSLVEEDFMAGGQSVEIAGTVLDDVRIGGAVLTVTDSGVIGDDLLAASYSLDIAPGSSIGGDVIYAGGQIQHSGNIAGDLVAATGALALKGQVGGDVDAQVGDATGAPPFNPMQFIPNMPLAPTIPGGFTVGPNAQVSGNLSYTSATVVDIPPNAVQGETTRIEPLLPDEVTEDKPTEPTTGDKILGWIARLIRNTVSLLLIGLLLALLLPCYIPANAEKLRKSPWPSLGWGILVFFGFFFAIFVVVFIIVILTIIFGLITLGDLALTIMMIGLAVVVILIALFKIGVHVSVQDRCWVRCWPMDTETTNPVDCRPSFLADALRLAHRSFPDHHTLYRMVLQHFCRVLWIGRDVVFRKRVYRPAAKLWSGERIQRVNFADTS